MPGQQHREAFVGHRKLDVCGRAVAAGRTLSRSVGHKVLVGGCMQSAADPHFDNADPHNDVGDPGAVDEEKLEGPGAVDGEDLEGLGAVGGEVVVGAQDQRVDPMFVFGQDWLRHEKVGEIEIDADVAYGRRQLVGERRMRVDDDADGGQPLASCCATAAGGQRRKAFGGKGPDGNAVAAVEEAVVKCRKAGFD